MKEAYKELNASTKISRGGTKPPLERAHGRLGTSTEAEPPRGIYMSALHEHLALAIVRFSDEGRVGAPHRVVQGAAPHNRSRRELALRGSSWHVRFGAFGLPQPAEQR